jgi:hypothetical protein
MSTEVSRTILGRVAWFTSGSVSEIDSTLGGLPEAFGSAEKINRRKWFHW